MCIYVIYKCINITSYIGCVYSRYGIVWYGMMLYSQYIYSIYIYINSVKYFKYFCYMY